jgi:teichuronic acid exporter
MISTLSLDFHYIIEQRQKKSSLVALWQISLLASGLCWLGFSLGAGLIGKLYQSDTLSSFFAYASIFVVVEILRRAVRAVATKQQQFKELALAETYNVIFYSIVSIVMLFFIRSVWVFLIIFYLGNALELIYLWVLNRKEIAQSLSKVFEQGTLLRKSICKYRSFVTQATTVSAINQVAGNAPILILGLWVNPAYLGLYYFASQLIGVPVSMLTAAISQVFFPVFSETKDAEIVNMTNRFVRLVGSLGLPLLMFFSLVLMQAVPWLFGDKWLDAVPLIPVMFVLFGSSLFINPIGAIPFVKRKPGWELLWNIGSFIVKVGAMLIGLRTSFVVAVWAYAIAGAVTNIAFYVMAMYLVKDNVYKALQRIGISLIPAIAYAVFIYAFWSVKGWLLLSISLAGCLLLLLLINVLDKGRLKADLIQLIS